MTDYRVGLIGCGWVAGEHIAAYRNNPQTELVALASYTKEEAKQKADECGVSVPVYDSLDAMLEKENLDIVSVTSPPDYHVEHAMKVAESGASLVLEKPIALTADSLHQLVACVKKNNTKSIVSFVLRWNPLYSIIRSLIDDGSLGELFYGEVDYYHGIGPWYKQYEWNITKRAGGSTLLSAGCHAVDGLVWFMGSRVKEVHAFGVHSKAEIYKAYEYDPTVAAILKFEDGRVGKVTSCIECKAPYMFRITLLGDKGTIKDNQLFCEKLNGQTNFATIPTILPDSGDVTHHPFQGEIDHLVERLDKGEDSDVPIDYAAHIIEICLAAERSAETGETVTLPL